MEIGCGQQTIKQTPHSRPPLPACNLTLRRPPPSIPAKAGISSRECGKFREAEVQCRLRRCVADDAAPRDSRIRGNGIRGREWKRRAGMEEGAGMEVLLISPPISFLFPPSLSFYPPHFSIPAPPFHSRPLFHSRESGNLFPRMREIPRSGSAMSPAAMRGGRCRPARFPLSREWNAFFLQNKIQ